ncbi:ABC transporter substrate-binding protein [Cellulosimicrobium cellulans]|uniref:ABC transporter substrate-binding protein n=1 Tax=Cellulosimicrobium cellulans TaxID=1710 RepID=UPI0024064D59|nr:ABC transporter substrate-binding protein [Cellulosimicrobium cellulans]MDF9877324.1 iron complex transport system substrate-binding protein [Cellulosimicrobium cellulans]
MTARPRAPRPRPAQLAVSALASAAALALLAACATSEPVASADTPESAAPAGTRTVDTAFGEVDLPADPQAALGVYTTDIDMLVTLGVPLAGKQPIRGDGYTAFPSFFDQEALAEVETFENFPEYNYEEMLNAAPDVILNGLGYDEDLVAKLPEIAPTYSYDGFDGGDWRDRFAEIAVAFDREAEHDAWLEKYEAKVAEVRAALDAADVHPVVAPVGYWDGSVTASCYGMPCLVFKDLGLEIPAYADSWDGTVYALEQVESLGDIDVMFASAVPDADGTIPDPFAEISDNALWAALPAVSSGNVVRYDMEMNYGSPSGQYAFLEAVEKALLP